MSFIDKLDKYLELKSVEPTALNYYNNFGPIVWEGQNPGLVYADTLAQTRADLAAMTAELTAPVVEPVEPE